MAIVVRIPTSMRTLTQGKEALSLDENKVHTVLDAIETLEQECPGMKARLLDESSRVRKFINVYVGEEDIRFLDGLNTSLRAGDDISIVPAIAGG